MLLLSLNIVTLKSGLSYIPRSLLRTNLGLEVLLPRSSAEG